jgi:hypothetical protein
MKIKVYGTETYEVCNKYKPFILDTQDFPELQLEIEAVAEASFMGDKQGEKNALEELYIKMYETSIKGSLTTSETIMSALGPFDGEPQEDQSDGEMVFNLLDVSLEDRSS